MNIADRTARNLAVSLSLYGKPTHHAGVTLITAPVPYSVFNIALLAAPLPAVAGELLRRLSAARAHFGALRHPWSFWICEADLPRREQRTLSALFASEGLKVIGESPGMVAQELAPQTRPLPELEFRPVACPETRRHFSQLVCASFHIPPPMASAVYEPPAPWPDYFRAWIGYHAGVPVTTAATVASHSVLGIYSVSTLPDLRHRGLAEAAVRQAISEARREHPTEPIVLQSSPSGLPLYLGLGFTRTARFFIYATPDSVR